MPEECATAPTNHCIFQHTMLHMKYQNLHLVHTELQHCWHQPLKCMKTPYKKTPRDVAMMLINMHAGAVRDQLKIRMYPMNGSYVMRFFHDIADHIINMMHYE